VRDQESCPKLDAQLFERKIMFTEGLGRQLLSFRGARKRGGLILFPEKKVLRLEIDPKLLCIAEKGLSMAHRDNSTSPTLLF